VAGVGGARPRTQSSAVARSATYGRRTNDAGATNARVEVPRTRRARSEEPVAQGTTLGRFAIAGQLTGRRHRPKSAGSPPLTHPHRRGHRESGGADGGLVDGRAPSNGQRVRFLSTTRERGASLGRRSNCSNREAQERNGRPFAGNGGCGGPASRVVPNPVVAPVFGSDNGEGGADRSDAVTATRVGQSAGGHGIGERSSRPRGHALVVTDQNPVNPRVGSGMQQARRRPMAQPVEVVQNHEDGARPNPQAGSGREGGNTPTCGRHRIVRTTEGRSLDNPVEGAR